MNALILSSMVGTLIKGGLLTYSTGISFEDDQGVFEVDGGILCIQLVESLVLDASVLVYEDALIKPDGEGPFQYREDEGYNNTYLQYDSYFISFRILVTFVSSLLYCPDYFEYFIASFDEELV